MTQIVIEADLHPNSPVRTRPSALGEQFVSYARNVEDVLLYRTLRDVTCGCYIDVGAAEPDTDSVTFAFYQRGWRGINMEPAPGAFARLAQARPDDINLNLMAGDRNGTASLFLVEGGDGLSTEVPSQTVLLQQQGWQIAETRVPVRTLASLVEEHAVGTAHFLRIASEGREREVLSGANLQRFRPWIIVVRSSALGAQAHPHQDWEDLLLVADYRFIWFDGLNRFYVAAEQKELEPALRTQPNLFDNFVRHSEAQALARLAQAQSGLAQAAAREQTQREAVGSLNTETAKLRAERDIWMQEVFEVNRFSAYLGQARQILLDSVQRLESEVIRLEGERKTLECERMVFAREVGRLEGERKGLEGEVLRLEGERKTLEREMQRVESERQHLERELQRVEQERRRYEIELQRGWNGGRTS